MGENNRITGDMGSSHSISQRKEEKRKGGKYLKKKCIFFSAAEKKNGEGTGGEYLEYKNIFAEEKKKVWSGLEKCITSECDHFEAVKNHFPVY